MSLYFISMFNTNKMKFYDTPTIRDKLVAIISNLRGMLNKYS